MCSQHLWERIKKGYYSPLKVLSSKSIVCSSGEVTSLLLAASFVWLVMLGELILFIHKIPNGSVAQSKTALF